MNTWQALKKIVRDQFFHPAPEPWDGKHELVDCKYIEHFGRMPDDYCTGWVWRCSCGTHNLNGFPRHWPYSEAAALQEFEEHRKLREKLGL